MRSLTIIAGHDKSGRKEGFDSASFSCGEIWAIAGETGAGKSRLMRDMELLCDGNGLTGRSILIDEVQVPAEKRPHYSENLIAHLGQSMRFTIDLPVSDFLSLHASSVGRSVEIGKVIELANTVTGEPLSSEQSLSTLSGGQSRALMIADIACISDRPVVLIDEIENAGIDKRAALSALCGSEKLVFIVTHDPHTALLAEGRIILSNGGISSIVRRSEKELHFFSYLDEEYRQIAALQEKLRHGEELYA